MAFAVAGDRIFPSAPSAVRTRAGGARRESLPNLMFVDGAAAKVLPSEVARAHRGSQGLDGGDAKVPFWLRPFSREEEVAEDDNSSGRGEEGEEGSPRASLGYTHAERRSLQEELRSSREEPAPCRAAEAEAVRPRRVSFAEKSKEEKQEEDEEAQAPVAPTKSIQRLLQRQAVKHTRHLFQARRESDVGEAVEAAEAAGAARTAKEAAAESEGAALTQAEARVLCTELASLRQELAEASAAAEQSATRADAAETESAVVTKAVEAENRGVCEELAALREELARAASEAAARAATVAAERLEATAAAQAAEEETRDLRVQLAAIREELAATSGVASQAMAQARTVDAGGVEATRAAEAMEAEARDLRVELATSKNELAATAATLARVVAQAQAAPLAEPGLELDPEAKREEEELRDLLQAALRPPEPKREAADLDSTCDTLGSTLRHSWSPIAPASSSWSSASSCSEGRSSGQHRRSTRSSRESAGRVRYSAHARRVSGEVARRELQVLSCTQEQAGSAGVACSNRRLGAGEPAGQRPSGTSEEELQLREEMDIMSHLRREVRSQEEVELQLAQERARELCRTSCSVS